jgi:hypothetical protein
LIYFSQMPKKKTSKKTNRRNRDSGTLTIGVASDALTPAEAEAAREGEAAREAEAVRDIVT